MLTLDKVYHAAYVLKNVIRHTDLIQAPKINREAEVYLKTENLQNTGSFKLRGAYYKISQLSEEEKAKGVIACSAGNHAQGVALAAQRSGIPAIICIPDGAPISKVENTKSYGARVELVKGVYDDAYRRACELQQETGCTFIHPFDDPDVIAGQGTIGLELLDQLPDVDAVIVPVGGGGLIAGVAFAVKSLNPHCKVYGVQAAGAPGMVHALEAGGPDALDRVSTFADGIAVKVPGDLTVPLIERYADDVVTVSDRDISEAVLLLMERCKQIVEPAGATPVAAVLKGKVDVKGKNVVCLLSGGNIDVSFIQCIIEQGLVARSRRLRFTVTLLDRPGSLGKLLNDIAALGANILSVEHDRLTAGLNPNEIDVHVSCEVGDKAHGDRVRGQLIQSGYHVKID